MKTSRIVSVMLMGLALCATPAIAQRGGGSHSSSPRSSASSASHSSSSARSSSSSMSRSSAPSRSSSSSMSRSSAPSRPSSSSVSRSSSPTRPSSGSVDRSSSPRRSSARVESTPAARSAARARHEAPASTPATPRANLRTPAAPRTSAPASPSNPRRTTGPDNGHARPGVAPAPGGHHLPPAARPIHPAPYFHHPWHGHVVHCHPLFWDPIPLRPLYWPGFWHYCNSYWYDYHVTDVVVVRDYVERTYKVDLVTYGISGDIMYAIVKDGGKTFLQVYDKDDHLLAEQKVNKKYCNMEIDAENGGCWISKKNGKDALLFIWNGTQLMIYEAD